MSSTKCVVILSARSSGSSALQNLLTGGGRARHVERTPHHENETLFWLKAAAVLNRPQVKMADSRLPLTADEARADLRALLRDNIGPHYTPPDQDEALVFDGWRDLCRHYAPIFIEKSPHHLHQWSALDLLVESMSRTPGVDLFFVALARNPLDTFYSMWTRWRGLPDQNQRDWLRAYRNLLRFQERVGDRLLIVRYEEMVRDPGCLAPLYRFMGEPAPPADYMHRESVGKWRGRRDFGFRLSDEATALAERYGYRRSELENRGSLAWPLQSRARRFYAQWKLKTL